MNQTRVLTAQYSRKLASSKPRESESKYDIKLLKQIALCVIPSWICVATGRPPLGALLLFLPLLPIIARQTVKKDYLGYATLIVGLSPAINYLGGFFFYNAVTLILTWTIVLWFIGARKEALLLWKNFRWRVFFILGCVYWLLSYYNTGRYFYNLRVLELIMMVGCIYLLSKHPRHLATALIGICISAFAISLAFLPYGDRLGSGSVGGYNLGNPISLGVPLTLVFFLGLVDNGKWLLLENHYYWRLAIALMAGAFLVLSGSRGSWLIVIVNCAILFLIDKRVRKTFLMLLGLLVLAVAIILATPRGQYVLEVYDRTTSSERDLANSTSGRSDQWEIFPEVFFDSPVWGFGPGRGAAVYAKYSILRYIFFAGGEIVWHSLFMQIGVETGMIGLAGLAFILLPLPFLGFAHFRRFNEVLPLIGILGYLLIAISVPALDGPGGLHLGFAFLSMKRRELPQAISAQISKRVPRLSLRRNSSSQVRRPSTLTTNKQDKD